MTNQEFIYWINGYLTLSDEKNLNMYQVDIIKNHANLVNVTLGFVDSQIEQFITVLEQEIKQHSKINVVKLRQIVALLDTSGNGFI